jgi:hypothetical protein
MNINVKGLKTMSFKEYANKRLHINVSMYVEQSSINFLKICVKIVKFNIKLHLNLWWYIML